MNYIIYQEKVEELINIIKKIPGKKTVCLEFKNQEVRIIDVSNKGRFGYASFHLWDFESVLNTAFNIGALITIWKFKNVKREKPDPYKWSNIIEWDIPQEVYGIVIDDSEIHLLPANVLQSNLKLKFKSDKNLFIHPSIYKDFSFLD